jgi:hypothetical protein
VRHPALTRQLAIMAAGTSIAEVHSHPGDTMATVRTTVVADEVGTITRTNRVYSPSAIDQAAIDDLASLVGLLSGNPFLSSADTFCLDGCQHREWTEKPLRSSAYLSVRHAMSREKPLMSTWFCVPTNRSVSSRRYPVRIPATVPNNAVLAISVQGGAASGGGLSLGMGQRWRPGADPGRQ